MNEELLVSIVLPVYNAEKYIKKSIDSILNQTYTNWELLIADDGSTDNTKKIVDNYNDKRIRVFHNEKNLGPFPTRNKLLKLAKGDLITFQDADDISLPNRIEEQVKAFLEDKELGIVGTWIEIILEDGKTINTMKYPLEDNEIKQKNQTMNAFFNPTAMIRREAYEKLGGFREYLLNGFSNQDYDWSYLISDYYKSKNIPKILYSYRQLGNSVSKKISPKRLIGAKVVQFLGKRRRENKGLDYIHTNELDIIDNYVNTLLKPYQDDRTLIYREYASKYMYAGLKKSAIEVSWRAVKTDPSKLINWRTLFYCMRKSIV
jgi:glycosyltransferase involved in cell wall biosynthesis